MAKLSHIGRVSVDGHLPAVLELDLSQLGAHLAELRRGGDSGGDMSLTRAIS